MKQSIRKADENNLE